MKNAIRDDISTMLRYRWKKKKKLDGMHEKTNASQNTVIVYLPVKSIVMEVNQTKAI